LNNLLDEYDLKNKVTAYVKDEGSNLNTMVSVFEFVVKCEVLGLEQNFQGTCFEHVFPKLVNMPLTMKKFVGVLNMCL
jgi:hypothetical protein